MHYSWDNDLTLYHDFRSVFVSWSIMNVCFYIAQYLFMHINTRFNRNRFRC